MDYIEFGQYLRNLRKSKNLTLKGLGIKAGGLSKSYLSNIENGRHGIPSPEILKKLADPLGVAYGELMYRAGYMDDGSLLINGKLLNPERNQEEMRLAIIETAIRTSSDGVVIDGLNMTQEEAIEYYKEQKNEYEEKKRREWEEFKKNNAKVYKFYSDDSDLYYAINNEMSHYKGNPLTDNDRKLIIEMFDRMFPERKSGMVVPDSVSVTEINVDDLSADKFTKPSSNIQKSDKRSDVGTSSADT